MDYLTVAQIADLESVSQEYIWAEIKRGKFPGAKKLDAAKETSPYLVPRKAYEAWKKRRAQPPSQDG